VKGRRRAHRKTGLCGGAARDGDGGEAAVLLGDGEVDHGLGEDEAMLVANLVRSRWSTVA
jgi:transketolase N-terminal domain/subunit